MSEKETPAEIERGYHLIAGRAARAGVEGAVDSGEISIEDLRQVAKEMFEFYGEDIREEHIRGLLSEADQGDGGEDGAGDGQISMDEFMIVLKKAGVF
mmetsp:Transcript_32706/g.51006  ORF Transcript_32706/g.51006 Transcript_32706/m.51006 type:complete len:98 (-) Transcript_32706:58-351(-)|eukprot:CAMPEP_0184296358 /NCGR_PEP_ID=MMETSP1049-20130417/7348_1 /TAXON_ID=77928 /ORGANISM="Proteomonas sulcata, Strain CCMP704" /LENGTH=97 /DNA_ID=CAMNT_0026605555 /DNA_START=91 /DNA_END=384 /DNA_ORIENTATION=+